MDPQYGQQPPTGQPYGAPPQQPQYDQPSGYGQPGGYSQPQHGQAPYGQQPQYGQQPYAGAYAAPMPQASANRWGPTSIGMDANIAAGLGYLIGILGVIFFFIEKTNRFLKFHCAQVILLAIAATALAFVDIFAQTFLFAASSAAESAALGFVGLFVGCLFTLAYLGLGGLWLWGMISAFTGKYTKLPIIGNIAERWAGGPPTPAF
jgi:uncharacterized membrane protein